MNNFFIKEKGLIFDYKGSLDFLKNKRNKI